MHSAYSRHRREFLSSYFDKILAKAGDVIKGFVNGLLDMKIPRPVFQEAAELSGFGRISAGLSFEEGTLRDIYHFYKKTADDVARTAEKTFDKERLLQNFKESRLARESSKFDNYLRREYEVKGHHFPERVEMPNGKRAYLSADSFDGKQTPVRSRSYMDSEGHIKWPEKGDGFILDSAGNPITYPADLKESQIIDRYGSSGGRFTSPVENGQKLAYDTRGLPYPEGYQDYHQYKVVKDISIEKIKRGYDRLIDIDKTLLKADMERYKKTFTDLANPQQGEIAKVFGAGGGTQIQLEMSVKWYEKLGLLKEIK